MPKKIVVGHTIAESNIVSYYQGKVVGIDVNEQDGNFEGIIIDRGTIEVINKKGERKSIKSGPLDSVVE